MNSILDLKNDFTGNENKGPIKTLLYLADNYGFFEVPHLIICYTDYLASLFANTEKRKTNLKDCVNFMNEFWPEKYKNSDELLKYKDSDGSIKNKKFNELIINMYRNGLVHEFIPKSLSNIKNHSIYWKITSSNDNKKHLSLEKIDDTKSNFILDIKCFLKDFIESSSNFFKKLEEDETLLKRVNDRFLLLRKPEPLKK